MSLRLLTVGIVALFIATVAAAQSPRIEMQVFPPQTGKGAVVIVVSGASGTSFYKGTASTLAAMGYYTVLVDGTNIYKRYAPANFDGVALLKSVIAESTASPQALQGKVALLGFSIGGAGVLVHGAQMKDEVSAAVAYYPAITSLGPNMDALASNIKVPVLLVVGVQDRYMECCLIETMRALAAAPKAAPFELVVYPAAEHGFNLEDTQFTYNEKDAQDAWAKTAEYLKRLHPPSRN